MSEFRPEFEFINWLEQNSSSRDGVILGIGDDTAILGICDESETLVTKDVLMAGVHFEESSALELVGRKSLAVNLSDIAAMGGEPVAAFVGLVLPKTFTRANVHQLYAGMQEIANDFNVSISGGDTNSWNGPLVISVTLIGKVAKGTAIRRSGAVVGDAIFVTGPLGGSLKSGRHFNFMPRIREALLLKNFVQLHSMMDLSDGLGSDLFHILSRSQVGAKIDAEKIPIHDDVDRTVNWRDRLSHAINDGEDFELLFTVSELDAQRLEASPPQCRKLHRIGVITECLDVTLSVAGVDQDFPKGGWSHHFGNDS